MKKCFTVLGKAGLALLVLLLAAGALSAQTKIRVKGSDAVIRIEPADKGEIVQDKLAAGTVFAVERKTGDWYEIKYRSAIGVLLSGFIHKSFVEEIKDDAAAAPKTEPEPVKNEIAREERAESAGGLRPGIELAVSGGMGFPSFTSGSSTLNNSYGPVTNLQTATETGSIDFSLKNPVALAASFAYFLTPSIGIRFQVDMPLKQSFSQADGATYSQSWKWYSVSTTWTDTATWPVSGDFSVTSLSLNGVARFPLASTIDAYITAGPSYFMGKINATSTMGLGLTWFPSGQVIDYFPIAVSISQSINKIGFNVGGGLDVRLGEQFGLFLEAAYFIGPSVTENWIFQPGSYPGSYFTTSILGLTQTTIDDLELNTRLTPLEVKLSFMKLAAGIKIAL